MPKLRAKLIQRLSALRERHRVLDLRVRDELSRPRPCNLRLQTLKRMRLLAKDQVSSVMQMLKSMRNPTPPAAA